MSRLVVGTHAVPVCNPSASSVVTSWPTSLPGFELALPAPHVVLVLTAHDPKRHSSLRPGPGRRPQLSGLRSSTP
jgi:hypothetical protein